jgi:hypothetical protein
MVRRCRRLACPARDRQVLGKITMTASISEELEHNPAQYLPVVEQSLGGEVVKMDLNQPMQEILRRCPNTRSRPGVDDRHHDRRAIPPMLNSASGWKSASRCRIIQEPSGLLRRPCQP